ncbi:YcnI family protein [Kutzneria sp. NPDC052558]|uniref:YcnI family protein n=1 Tax=Kutzneria sp. NPDC052558 TaxID=3364121 RepID=UPI0037CC5369
MLRLMWTLPAVALVLLATAAPAAAHITVHSDDAVADGYAQIAFRVPTESDTAATTSLQVAFPADHRLASVAVRPHPGWTYQVTKSTVDPPLVTDDGVKVTEAVSQIDWTATGPDTAVKPGEYDEFLIEAGPLPKADRLEFKAVQTYSDGTVVRWIDSAAADAEHPAPVLAITPAAIAPAVAPAAEASAASPPWALGAATVAVLIAAVSVALAWRRTRRRAD